MPWKFVNLDRPPVGTVFRMALQYNDRVPDDPALRQVECFKMKLMAPRRFGWFVLSR